MNFTKKIVFFIYPAVILVLNSDSYNVGLYVLFVRKVDFETQLGGRLVL